MPIGKKDRTSMFSIPFAVEDYKKNISSILLPPKVVICVCLVCCIFICSYTVYYIFKVIFIYKNYSLEKKILQSYPAQQENFGYLSYNCDTFLSRLMLSDLFLDFRFTDFLSTGHNFLFTIPQLLKV